MIDTVVLSYELNSVSGSNVIDPATYDGWSPSLVGILIPPYIKMGGRGEIASVLNLSDKKAGIYAPRLTLYKRIVQGGFRCILYIEFSAPKLLLGNNFEELTNDDLDSLCKKLSKSLKDNGVYISDNELRNSTVKVIHYSKNIIYEDGTLPSMAIRYLEKASLPISEREQTTNFVNGGDALYNSPNLAKNFCVYDKKKELNRAKTTEKGNLESESWCQFKLLDLLDKQEVLRLELRLSNKKSIRQELDKLNISYSRQELPFSELFSSEISQQLLMERIDYMEVRIPKLLRHELDIEDLSEQLFALNLQSKPSILLKAIGFYSLINVGWSTRQIRKCLGMTSQQWSYLISTLRNLAIPNAEFDPLKEVKEQLAKFQPVVMNLAHGDII